MSCSAMNKRLRDTAHRYEEAIIDTRRSREEKRKSKDIVGRLRREWEGTRNARDEATKQRDLVHTLEMLRVNEEQRIEGARREDEIRTDVSRGVEDEAARGLTEQRLIEEARERER